MKKLIISCFLFSSALCFANQPLWNLNDVSYLFRIPKSAQENHNHLLNPRSAGNKGILFPLKTYEALPTLNNSGNGKQRAYEEELRVIALRIDPCPNTFDANQCQPEMRLVWQPLELDPDSQEWFAQDAAVHTFYKLTSEEFSLLKKQLWTLKIKSTDYNISTDKAPLNIHPAFLKEQTFSWFNDSLNKIILHHCGEKNLVKVTFMSLLTPNVWWRFGGVTPKNGRWTNMKIPRLLPTFQDIFNSAFEPVSMIHNPGVEMDAIFNIHPDDYPVQDNIFKVINKGFRYNDERDLPVFEEKLHAVERFKNPHFSNPDNLDCASCHYADATRFYAEKTFPSLKNFSSPYAFKNPNSSLFNLENSTIGKTATRVVRAFGYFHQQPAINQRVINDSAETAHWLNNH